MVISKKFISYKDDNDEVVNGYFEIIQETGNYLKFLSGRNRITIPWNRILKFKESSNNMEDKNGK